MNADEVIKTLEKWQLDGMHCDTGVFVKYFYLMPQATGFYLRVEFDVMGQEETAPFYGTIAECVEQAVGHLKYIREDLIKKLEVQNARSI